MDSNAKFMGGTKSPVDNTWHMDMREGLPRYLLTVLLVKRAPEYTSTKSIRLVGGYILPASNYSRSGGFPPSARETTCEEKNMARGFATRTVRTFIKPVR